MTDQARSELRGDGVAFRHRAVTVAAVADPLHHSAGAIVGLARGYRTPAASSDVRLWHVIEAERAVRPMGTQD
jgi:hypothetical protein